MSYHPLIVATANPGKCREIGEILRDMPLALTSLRDHWDPPPEIPENGETFLENAFAKADWVFSRVKDAWVLADDSGLEVDFLSGDPGIRSARYAGPHANDEENNRKLLVLLSGCPPERRTARFRCVMVLRMGRSDSLVAEGVCEGMIGHEPRGAGGFGYDPVFAPAGENLTFAELDPSIKNRISHRGKALRELRSKLELLLGR